jgi:REP element-mobilizing transposase RayT
MIADDPYPRRRHMRLKNYDYSQAGAYFVTICAYARAPIFGSVRDGEVQLTSAGRICEEEWLRTPRLRRNILLDEYVLMPNHIHGILFILEDPTRVSASPGMIATAVNAGPPTLRQPSRTAGAIIRGFKSATTSRVRRLSGTATRVWQTQYYDHIIRDEDDLHRIREYIVYNPFKWELDRFFVAT